MPADHPLVAVVDATSEGHAGLARLLWVLSHRDAYARELPRGAKNDRALLPTRAILPSGITRPICAAIGPRARHRGRAARVRASRAGPARAGAGACAPRRAAALAARGPRGGRRRRLSASETATSRQREGRNEATHQERPRALQPAHDQAPPERRGGPRAHPQIVTQGGIPHQVQPTMAGPTTEERHFR